ncbi:unnamed protein product, partial [Timema podura]|nr:unnamed protein product [Timema podura]
MSKKPQFTQPRFVASSSTTIESYLLITRSLARLPVWPPSRSHACCRGMTTEIPVWVNSRQRWVTGVNKKTTCDEVIAVLLGAEAKEATSHGYAIMERWRRVERPLDSRARILKVWEAWGDERGEVRLTLKRVDWEADSGRGSPVNRDPHRKRRH